MVGRQTGICSLSKETERQKGIVIYQHYGTSNQTTGPLTKILPGGREKFPGPPF